MSKVAREIKLMAQGELYAHQSISLLLIGNSDASEVSLATERRKNTFHNYDAEDLQKRGFDRVKISKANIVKLIPQGDNSKHKVHISLLLHGNKDNFEVIVSQLVQEKHISKLQQQRIFKKGGYDRVNISKANVTKLMPQGELYTP